MSIEQFDPTVLDLGRTFDAQFEKHFNEHGNKSELDESFCQKLFDNAGLKFGRSDVIEQGESVNATPLPNLAELDSSGGLVKLVVGPRTFSVRTGALSKW